MGWIRTYDPKTGEVRILGEVPVKLTPLPPEDDPLYPLIKATHAAQLLNATNPNHEDCVLYRAKKGGARVEVNLTSEKPEAVRS